MTDTETNTPQQAVTEDAIMALPFTNLVWDRHGSWVEVDTMHVEVGDGEDLACVRIPRARFDDIVRWYLTGAIPSWETRKPTEGSSDAR